MDLRSLVFSIDFKNVDGSPIKEMDKNMDNMKKSMEGVGSQANKMGKDLKKSMSGAAKETSLISKSFEKLKQSIAGQMMSRGIDTIKIAVERAKTSLGGLGSAFEKIKTSHIGEKIGAGLNKVKSVVSDVASNITTGLGGAFDKIKNSAVGEKIGAGFNKLKGVMGSVVSTSVSMGNRLKSSMDKFKISISNAIKDLEKLGKSMTKVGKSMMTKVTLPIVGFGAASIKTVASFDDAMANVQKLSGATGKGLDNLRNKAKELGVSTAFSASEAAEGMGVLASSGMKVNDILKTSEDMFNLMSAGSIDSSTAASVLTNTMSQFNLKASKSGYIVNTFAATAAKAKVGVGDLEHIMSQAGSTLASMNMTVDESTASFGHLANAGLPVQQLGSIVNAMGREVKSNADKFKGIGIDVYDSITGKLKTMGVVMKEVEDAVKGKSNAERDSILQTVFSGQAMQGAVAWIERGFKAYGELTDAIIKEKNAAKTMALIQENTVGGAFRAVKSAIEGLMIEVGDVLKKPTQEVAKFVMNLTREFGNLSDPMKKVVVVIAGIAAAIGPVIFVIAKVISVFMGLGPAISTLGTVFSVLTGPIGIIVALVVGLVATLIHLWRTNEGFRDAVIGIWESIQTHLGTALEYIKSLWETHGESIKTTVMNVFDIIKNIILISLTVVLGIVVVALESIKLTWALFGETIMNLVSSAWNFIQGIISGAMNIIQGIIDITLGIISGNWSQAWNGLVSVFSGAIEIIKSLWQGAVSLLSTPIDAVVNLLDTVFKSKLEGVKKAWNGLKNFLKSPITGVVNLFRRDSGGKADGSHASGAYNIPFDNYMANLHKGEMVLTKSASDMYRAMGGTENSVPTTTTNNYSTSTTTVRGSSEGKSSGNSIIFSPTYHIEISGTATESDKQEIEKVIDKKTRELFNEFFKEMNMKMA